MANRTHSVEIQSPRLQLLQGELLKALDNRAEMLDTFWREVAAAGTPLVERDPGRPEHGDPIASVSIHEPFSWKKSEERHLSRLDGTDIWSCVGRYDSTCRAPTVFRSDGRGLRIRTSTS